MKNLSEKQRGWVEKIHFQPLEKMVDSRCPKSLTMWLVDRVDTVNGTLEVCGKPVDIKKGVERILKLPAGVTKVPQPLNGRSKAKGGENVSSVEKHSDNGRGQTAKDATKDLLAEQENEVDFIQTFVMLVLCIYLAPTTSLNINRGYLPSLLDITKIHLMDWCGYIAEYLIRGGVPKEQSISCSSSWLCPHIAPFVYRCSDPKWRSSAT